MPYAFFALAVLFGTVAPIVLRSQTLTAKLSAGLILWALLSASLFPLVGSPINPMISGGPQTMMLQRVIVAAWWLVGARLVVLGSMVWFGVRDRHHQARLASDLASTVVYVGAILVILDKVFNVAVTGLVATSGVIAIVLGLALQNTLGDLFSGIAIGLERPFKVGDRIWIEGSIEGSVTETNWRSTRIMTDSSDLATVPNSVIAKARLMNRSRPTEIRTDTIQLVLDPRVSPERGIALLQSAAATTPGIAAEPPASIYCTELRGEGNHYSIGFSASRRDLARTRSRLLTSISRHAFFGGVAIASDKSLPLTQRGTPEAADVIGEFDLFADCLQTERDALAESLISCSGSKGDVLVSQNEVRTSLFLVVAGLLDVIVNRGEGDIRVGAIGPGDHIGELSLLAGEPSLVTIKATSTFLAYELTKESLAPTLRANPRLLQAFEAGATRVRARINRFEAEQAGEGQIENTSLMTRIRAFFDIPR